MTIYVLINGEANAIMKYIPHNGIEGHLVVDWTKIGLISWPSMNGVMPACHYNVGEYKVCFHICIFAYSFLYSCFVVISEWLLSGSC